MATSAHTAVLHNDFQIDQVLDPLREKVQLRNANFLRNASPFVLDNVESAVVHVARYAHTQGGTFRELPQFLALKHCIVNVKNEDNRCFGYSIIASRVPQNKSRHRNRPADYNQYFKTMGLDKVHYPVEANQVPALEDTLKTNISVFSFYGLLNKRHRIAAAEIIARNIWLILRVRIYIVVGDWCPFKNKQILSTTLKNGHEFLTKWKFGEGFGIVIT